MFGDKVEEFITWSCTSQYQAKYDYWPFNHPTFPKILNSKIPINVYLSIVSLGVRGSGKYGKYQEILDIDTIVNFYSCWYSLLISLMANLL